MFAFILGFLMGGAAGAAIVLRTSPQFQFQGGPEEANGLSGEDARTDFRDKIEEAFEEGQKAADEKIAELNEMVRRLRGPGSKQEE